MKIIKNIVYFLVFFIINVVYPIKSVFIFCYQRNWKYLLYGIIGIPFCIIIPIMWTATPETPYYSLKMYSAFLYLIGGVLQINLIIRYNRVNQERKIYYITHLT